MNGKIQIVALQRGWAVIGRVQEKGANLRICVLLLKFEPFYIGHVVLLHEPDWARCDNTEQPGSFTRPAPSI